MSLVNSTISLSKAVWINKGYVLHQERSCDVPQLLNHTSSID